MPAVGTALVVGGGAAGAATAILLAEAGVAVDLVEAQPEVSALGSGITLQGNALRVLRRLGVLEQCAALGYECSGLLVRAADPDATVLAQLPDLRFGGPDLPGTMGMYRPDLARVLMARADEVGVTARFATTVEALDQDPDGVDVRFADGTQRRYDLVVGADGVRSATRHLLGIPLDTRALGMGAWRMVAPRPATTSPRPSSSSAARATSPASPRPGRTPRTGSSSRTPRTAPLRPRPSSSTPSASCPGPTTVRGTRSATGSTTRPG